MATTKRTARITNLDDSSFYAPISEISDVPPSAPSTLSDSILAESGEEVQNDPPIIDLSGQAAALPESSSNDFEPSTSSRYSNNSEVKHSRLHAARESHSVEKREGWKEPTATQRDMVYFADAPQESDLVQLAKSMLRDIPFEEREAVKGVGTLDLETILALLAKADGEEDAEDEASDSTSGESDQEEDDKEEEEADAEEEQPQQETDAEKGQPPVEDPKEAAGDTKRPPTA
ncbi:protein-methionine sulfoxide oxidase mical3a-like [Chenopodium quinoa]|uniref:protein-methionine sulfoxide oxidase mical3a-like n=1 Tax=Chenopodium quinoa TaxID=63459 RepID=UPI000B7756C3|nr:protein-methionine sulfoxide oxidase mical3a-like [Chenopodium quinoa]